MADEIDESAEAEGTDVIEDEGDAPEDGPDLSIFEAKIAELTAANATLQAQVQALKSANYDLLQSLAGDAGEGSDEGDLDDEVDPTDSTTDDLFEN